jgi:hypothetical protein
MQGQLPVEAMTAADPPKSSCQDLTPYVGEAASTSPEPKPTKSGGRSSPDEATFTAQMLGQTGARRGLKGGPPVLKQARSAYLETEYSGPNDRRPPAGLIRKTEI